MARIARNIKDLRVRQGLSQAALGEAVGVTSRTVSSWETGDRIPRLGKTRLLADFFGVTMTQLERGEPSGVSEGTVTWGSPRHDCFVPLYDSASMSSYPGGARKMGEVPLSSKAFREHPNAFFLVVDDASMDRVIPQGSLALIDPDAEIRDGDAVAVSVSGGPVRFARYHRLSRSVALQPESHDHEFQDELISEGEVAPFGRIVMWWGSPSGE